MLVLNRTEIRFGWCSDIIVVDNPLEKHCQCIYWPYLCEVNCLQIAWGPESDAYKRRWVLILGIGDMVIAQNISWIVLMILGNKLYICSKSWLLLCVWRAKSYSSLHYWFLFSSEVFIDRKCLTHINTSAETEGLRGARDR